MKYKAAIFDMDGTILDTLDDLTDATNYALVKHGFPTCTREAVRSFVGNGAGMLMKRALGIEADERDCSSKLFETVYADYFAYYTAHCTDKTKAYDGILEVLSRLRACGIRTAVVSNKPHEAVVQLCRNYFPDLFDEAVGTRAGIKEKPAPDAVLEIIKKLGVQKDACVYVGDSDVDIDTAKNSELACISVSWGFKSREFLEAHGATRIVDAAAELEELLLDERGNEHETT
ncbi:MAG: HAD-IA family hydrolase [Treponema sp.]|nr:HAD-IA family hydrolase [Treponema sp.]